LKGLGFYYIQHLCGAKLATQVKPKMQSFRLRFNSPQYIPQRCRFWAFIKKLTVNYKHVLTLTRMKTI